MQCVIRSRSEKNFQTSARGKRTENDWRNFTPSCSTDVHSTASKFSTTDVGGCCAFTGPAVVGCREKSFGVVGGCEPTGPIVRPVDCAIVPDVLTVFSALWTASTMPT